MRSIGPETLTAATIDPSLDFTGALTDATPASRSSTLATHPGAGTTGQCLAGGAGVEREQHALWHDPAQRVRRLQRQDTAPLGALTHEQLHALAACVAELLERRPRQGRQWVALCRRPPQRRQLGAEVEAPVAVTSQQTVPFERDREAVGRRPRQIGGLLQIGQRPRLGGDCAQDRNRLVEHPNAGYSVHTARILSQKVGMSKCLR